MRILGSAILLCNLILQLVKSEGLNGFERVGNMQLLIGNETVSFTTAEDRCHKLNSRLAEIRSEKEWNEVGVQ